MRILGVDPGSITTGFGVVDYERGRLQLVERHRGLLPLDTIVDKLASGTMHLKIEGESYRKKRAKKEAPDNP